MVEDALGLIEPTEADLQATGDALASAQSAHEKIVKAKEKARQVFQEDQPMWADGVIDMNEFTEGMMKVLEEIPEEKERVRTAPFQVIGSL